MNGIGVHFVDGEPPGLDQFWQCPLCETQMAMGTPGKLHPPKCGMGHKLTEMEQITKAGWHPVGDQGERS